jgi:hypothetical protein
MSDLYKIGRLVNDPKFNVTVEAAMLKHAQTVPIGASAPVNEKNFAIWVLKNPMSSEISMVALVASDASVLSSTTLSGDEVDVSAIPDSAITSVVSAKWSLVATKYAP